MKLERIMRAHGLMGWHRPCRLAALLVAFLYSSLIAVEAADTLESLRGFTMGTSWSVKYLAPANAPAKAEVGRALQALLDRLEGQISTWRDDTDLSRFNAARSADWFPMPRQTAQIAMEAQRISELTGGAFDVTVDPIVRLWGFGPHGRPGTVPSAQAIEEARVKVGWQKLAVRLDPPALKKSLAALSVDLSALAPGFAADEIGGWLETHGITNYLADASELRARGRDSGGRPWRVGVERPVPGRREVDRVLSLDNVSLATSGDYRNFFEKEGRRYTHIVDPRTGQADARVAAVTVAHPLAMTADALATGLMVLGPEAGMKLAREQRWAVQFIVRDGRSLRRMTTPEFDRLVVP